MGGANTGRIRIDATSLDQFARSIQNQMREQMRQQYEPTEDEYEAFLRKNPRILTTGRESLDLLLGIALIAWVFGFVPLSTGQQTWQYIFVLTIIISPAFILHELAHKYMAIRYGKYARFTLVRQMALFTFIAGLIGIPIAGPGATMILGKSTEEESGIFSAAGPATNFIISSISFLLATILPESIYFPAVGHTLVWILLLSTLINGVLGVFNLIPLGNLDGRKILSWNSAVWIGLVLLNLPMILISYPILYG